MTMLARTTAEGTRILLRSDPQSHLTALALAVPAGRGADPEGRAGLAHMVEHLALKEQRSGQSPLSFSLNAFTTRDLTVYETVCAPEQAETAARSLLRVLSGMPHVNQTVLDIERRIIDVEAGGVGGPMDRADSVMGAHQDRATVTVADLIAFHTVHYRPERAVMAVTGAADPDALTSALDLHPRGGVAQQPTTTSPPQLLRPVQRNKGNGDTTHRFLAPSVTSPHYAVAAAVCVGLTGAAAHHFDLAATTAPHAKSLQHPGAFAYQGRLHPGRAASTLVLTVHHPGRPFAALRPRLDPARAKAETAGAIALLREDPLLAARAEAGWALYRSDGLDGLANAVEAAAPDAVLACANEVLANV